jgi:hypothetical protein
MIDEKIESLYKQIVEKQDKYTHLLLAVTASAIAFSVQKTENAKFAWSLIPMGFAILAWGSSFYCGCKNLLCTQDSMKATYSLLQISRGVHIDQPSSNQELTIAMKDGIDVIKEDTKKAYSFEMWQYRLLIIGAICFLIWHILGIWLRT